MHHLSMSFPFSSYFDSILETRALFCIACNEQRSIRIFIRNQTHFHHFISYLKCHFQLTMFAICSNQCIVCSMVNLKFYNVHRKQIRARDWKTYIHAFSFHFIEKICCTIDCHCTVRSTVTGACKQRENFCHLSRIYSCKSTILHLNQM